MNVRNVMFKQCKPNKPRTNREKRTTILLVPINAYRIEFLLRIRVFYSPVMAVKENSISLQRGARAGGNCTYLAPSLYSLISCSNKI